MAERHKNQYEFGGQLNIEINGHHSCYDKMIDYLLKYRDDFNIVDDFLASVKDCFEKNNIVEIRFYTMSPSGFFSMFGSDLEEVAKRMVEAVKEEYEENHVHFPDYKLLKDK